MESKSQQIRHKLAAGDQIGALRIAAKFCDRSSDTKIYQRGFDAYKHPGFYRQLGHDPERITSVAVRVLVRKFGELKPMQHRHRV